MNGAERQLDEITSQIIDSAIGIHRALGPGLLESVYEIVLARDLARRGFDIEKQKSVSFDYDGLRFEDAFRVDLLIQGCVAVEIKSVEKIHPVHSKQVLTYLRLLRLPLGLLINFGAPTLKQGLHRVVNGLPSSASSRLRVNQQHPKGELPRNL
jgi:iron complex transport system substrate-binding protein